MKIGKFCHTISSNISFDNSILFIILGASGSSLIATDFDFLFSFLISKEPGFIEILSIYSCIIKKYLQFNNKLSRSSIKKGLYIFMIHY
jgi:hypothetical protein